MASDLNGVRKSAILLLSLPQDEAAEILKRLPPEAVEEVSREIASMGEVNMTSRDATTEPGKSGCVIPKAPKSTAQAASRPPAR